MWQFFLILYFVFATASYLQRRVMAQKFSQYNLLLNGVFFVFFLFPASLVIGFLSSHNFDIGAENYLLLIGGSFIWPLFAIVSFRANKEIDVGIYSIIVNVSPIFTLMIAIPLLNESLNFIQSIGVVLLIFSGLVAGKSQLSSRTKANPNGLILCFVCAVMLGLATAYERYMLNRIDFGTYVLLGWGSQIIWMAILAVKQWSKLPKLIKDVGKVNVFGYGLLSTLKAIFFISALLLSGSASIIGSATNFVAVLVVIAAYFVLKERQHMLEKLASVAIGLVGIIMLTV